MMSGVMAADAATIVRQVRRSRKYRHLCEATVARVAAWAISRSTSQKDALKRTKRKLHQVYAAYLQRWDFDRARAILDALPPGADEESLRSACRQIMMLHTSTRERLGLLETMYDSIFEITGPVESVLDIGCGLHPLSLPWMSPAPLRYRAWDIDERMIELLNCFFAIAHLPREAACRDILAEMPTEPADVAFLMKTLPCLERQEVGSGLRVIRELPARFVVVSFPARSLSGRSKNMPQNYATAMEALLAQGPWPAGTIDCGQELIYVVDKRSR